MTPPDSCRVAILNGFGRALGDSVVGLQALATALELGALAPRPVLFRLSGLPPVIQGTYAAAADLCEVRDLPWARATRDMPFAGAAGFERCIDIRDFAFDPGFRGVAMVDYFLNALSLRAQAVPSALRRNRWLACRIPPERQQGYALVCPRTSTALRSMPNEVHAVVVRALARHGLNVLTQGEPVAPARPAPDAATLAELCALVSAAAVVISADTAMMHLADAYSVPCLAFFTTHRPELRVRDYPTVRAVHLGVPGLPEALEFARDAGDAAAARQAWFQRGADLAWIVHEVTRFVDVACPSRHLWRRTFEGNRAQI
jgi:Glycosyltransferase family 9 (heptosyltransferase)